MPDLTDDEVNHLCAAWEGVMVEYMEQDFPTSQPYKRRIPGWKCTSCGYTIGTAGLPPSTCECGKRWRVLETDNAT